MNQEFPEVITPGAFGKANIMGKPVTCNWGKTIGVITDVTIAPDGLVVTIRMNQ
jgi:hypothetical protein